MIRVGTSGWSYDHWHPELYGTELAARDRLARYADVFCTAELNSSFYRWPRPAAFASWHRRLPDGFRLSVKAPRGLTHGRRLYAPETWLERIAAGWHELGEKRAVLLVQLAPSQPRDDARLAYFLRLVPEWMRVAVEFRHGSWHCPETLNLLEAHRAAYCVMSGADLPCLLRATTDFVYVRMHGPDHHHLYAGSYSDADLMWWAERAREWNRLARTCSSTSITTATPMRSATPGPCSTCSAGRQAAGAAVAGGFGGGTWARFAQVTLDAFDVVVLGAGSAGEWVAGAVADAGRSVALVEKLRVGGECPYVSCIPSKAMLRSAEARAVARRVADLGGASGPVQVDATQMPSRPRCADAMTCRTDVMTAMRPRIQDRGATLIRGRGRITGPGRVDVGGRELAYRDLVVGHRLAAGCPAHRRPRRRSGLDQRPGAFRG